MADEKIKQDTTEPAAEPKTIVLPEATSEERQAMDVRQRTKRRGLIATIVVAGVIVFVLLSMAGYFMLTRLAGNQYRTDEGYTDMGTSRMGRLHQGVTSGQYIQTQVSSDSVTTTVYNYVRGVVVAVNSDSIVIAGNGKQTTVKTNSSTKYTNDVKPAVNDTVTIVGTTTDSAITATEIGVINQ